MSPATSLTRVLNPRLLSQTQRRDAASNIRGHCSKACEDAINAQINVEYNISYIYHAMVGFRF